MTRFVSLLFVLALSGCLYDLGVGSLQRAAPQQVAAARDPHGPIDILFVVDNSGSMTEEQEELARTIFKSECPIQDLMNVPRELQNPTRDVLDGLATVCGFSQILAAYDRDFRIGVITTDVNACDNLIPDAQGGVARGHRPQRGCLQPTGSGDKMLAREDRQLAARFTQMVTGVGTFGSPFERAIDAVDIFLARAAGRQEGPNVTWVAEGCEEDATAFIRSDAELLLVFVGDEDDCSHADGAFGFDSETVEVCAPTVDHLFHATADCRTDVESLMDVDGPVARWQELKGTDGGVRALVIGGGVRDDDGLMRAAGCVVGDDGEALGGCFESGGMSSFTRPGDVCDPATTACCTADPSTRLFLVADLLGGERETICSESFTQPLIDALATPSVE